MDSWMLNFIATPMRMAALIILLELEKFELFLPLSGALVFVCISDPQENFGPGNARLNNRILKKLRIISANKDHSKVTGLMGPSLSDCKTRGVLDPSK